MIEPKYFKNYAEGGASRTKPTLKTWTPQHFSAKYEVERNLALLRGRAASLAKNSPVGAAAVNSMTTNVIGAGLKLFPRLNAKALKISTDYARDWARNTKREFELWAESALACDFLKRNNFAELQSIAFTSYLTDGDCFCLFKRRLPTAYNPYSLRLQLIEAGRVSNPLTDGALISNVEMTRGKNRIVNGIEVNSDGVQVAVWISNRILNEPDASTSELKWQRVRWFGRDTGCRNLLHICKDVRPDQFRGIPLLAPVIESLKQISRYGDAELTSAIIKSFFSVFFIQPQNNLGFNQILGVENSDEPIVDVSEYKLGPATMSALPRGVDVKSIDSSNAQSTFDAFTGSFLKQVGAALNLPYEVLMKNFQSSYSASRAALLQAADEFRVRRAAFINDFCQPIYEQFLTEAVALGRIDAPGFFDEPIKRAAYLTADWRCETSRFIDPLKEAQATVMRLEHGLSTYHKELAESNGLDFDDVLEELAQERELLAQLKPKDVIT